MTKRVVIALLTLAVLVPVLQVKIDGLKENLKKTEDRPFCPPRARWVKAAALGCHTLIADLYWLRTIQYREALADRGEFPADLYAMADFITDLDPRFHLVYFYAGLNLMMESGDQNQIISILKKGERNCPHYWKIPFLLGFYYFMTLQDYNRAADHIEAAYKINRHWTYGRLASSLRAEGGSPELAIRFLKEMIRQTHDQKNIRLFKQRIKELEAKKQEGILTKKSRRYFEIYGAYPSRLDDLAAAGLLQKIPGHPLRGHRFIFDLESKKVLSDPRVEVKVHDPWKTPKQKRGKKRKGG